MGHRNERRIWDDKLVEDFRRNAKFWSEQHGSASIVGAQLNTALDRVEMLEKWLKDEGYEDCGFCYELAPTEERGDLRICANCREEEKKKSGK